MINEIQLLRAIADRAVSFYASMDALDGKDIGFARAGILDEICLVHRRIVPLRLQEMLAASDLDFMHDVAGIHKHLEYGTRTRQPQLKNCFVPRFAEVK